MSLLSKCLNCVHGALGSIAPKSSPAKTRRAERFRPNLEPLEVRAMLAANMALGMNLDHLGDWTTTWMFTDVFKQSRPWMAQTYDTVARTLTPDAAPPANLDANGWPTLLLQGTNAQGHATQQFLSTTMFTNIDGHYPAGTYTAWWDGTGTLQWRGDVRVTQTGLTADGHHYALLNDRPGSGGIQLTITSMSATDPIHDVHVWMPDYNGQSFVGQVWHPGASFSPFHPLFLQRLAPLHTLRFMQMEDTDSSDVQHWSDRRSWRYETQASWGIGRQNGVALEYQIELANELHANMWVNMPHMADDDYVRRFAQQVHDALKPGLQVYVEWSNEVWNGAPGYVASRWIASQLPSNATAAQVIQFVARQETADFDIWSQVMADHPGRLVRTVAFNAPNTYTINQLLQAMNGHFDALAVNGYFGPMQAVTNGYNAGTTVNQIISDVQASVPSLLNILGQDKAIADRYAASLGRPIQMLVYEGGPSLVAANPSYQQALFDAGNDPRMHDIYLNFLNGVDNLHFDLFMNYTYTAGALRPSPFGAFGSLRWQDQPAAAAPKYRALMDYSASHPTVPITAASPAPPTPPAPTGTSSQPAPSATTPAQTLPVLLVIGNQDFYYKEYNDTRLALEAAGLRVVVAAAARIPARPHANSGQGTSSGIVTPDIALSDVNASNYSAIAFVGGWGASDYQYAFSGTYANAAYNGSTALRVTVNQLISDFVHQNKYVTAICHGVSVLAWARVDGQSPLAGKNVATFQGNSPSYSVNGVIHASDPDNLMATANGAHVAVPGSIGNPNTANDDVVVDGKIITAQNWDSATLFGQVIAQRLLS